MITAVKILVLAIVLLLSACTSTPPTAFSEHTAAPADLTLDVTVLAIAATPSDSSAPAAHMEPHLRPSRFVLFPDGSLHYGPDPDNTRGVSWLPPMTRMLSRRQVAEVWSLMQQLGLANPEAGDPIMNLKLVNPKVGERVYVVDLFGFDQHWNFVRPGSIDESPNPAMAQLVQHLARLAWVSELDDSQRKVMPKRYDFGPDPYLRYRTKN